MIIDTNTLFETGWTTFNLKDYWLEKWNELNVQFDKSVASNEIKYFRFDGEFNEDIRYIINEYPTLQIETLNIFPTDGLYNIHSLWTGPINDLKHLKQRLESLARKSYQHWYSTDAFGINLITQSIYKKIVNEVYQPTKSTYDKFRIDMSLYDINCHIEDHQDSMEDSKNRYCAILMYLNNDWNDTKGGELVIDGKITIQPNFGNIVILDFLHNNIKHSVNSIKDTEFNRMATISFINK